MLNDEDQNDHSAYERAIDKAVRENLGVRFNLTPYFEELGDITPTEIGDAVMQVASNTYVPPVEYYPAREMQRRLVKTSKTVSDVRIWSEEYFKTTEYSMAFAVHRMAGVIKAFDKQQSP